MSPCLLNGGWHLSVQGDNPPPPNLEIAAQFRQIVKATPRSISFIYEFALKGYAHISLFHYGIFGLYASGFLENLSISLFKHAPDNYVANNMTPEGQSP